MHVEENILFGWYAHDQDYRGLRIINTVNAGTKAEENYIRCIIWQLYASRGLDVALPVDDRVNRSHSSLPRMQELVR